MMSRILSLLVLLLAACSPAGTDRSVPAAQQTEQCDGQRKYCLDFSAIMGTRKWTDDWTDTSGAATDHTISNGKSPENTDYIRADIYSIASCSPSVIGASQTQVLPAVGRNTIWGKVDYPLDYELNPLVPDCRPYKPVSASYILCAEKDGRRVAVCVMQVTDNPELAEQIFKTFRWTD